MESRVNLLWTAHCRIPGVTPPDNTIESPSSGYHIQRRFSLRYFPAAAVSVTMDGSLFEGPMGCYFCIPPDVPFYTDYRSYSSSEYFDIIFLPNDPFLQEDLQKLYPPRAANPTERVMLDYIVENWHREDPAVHRNCEDFLTSLLLLLFAEQTKPETSGSQFILTEGYSKAALTALNYVELHYYAHFSLDDMARSTGYNKSYLCTAFSRSTGVSVVTYTNFLRIRKAIGSILYYPRSLSMMAVDLGFDNPNYFGRTFKNFTGISPRDFNLVARSMTPEEKANLYAGEALLNYRKCPFEEALGSMRHIGAVFRARYEKLVPQP